MVCMCLVARKELALALNTERCCLLCTYTNVTNDEYSRRKTLHYFRPQENFPMHHNETHIHTSAYTHTHTQVQKRHTMISLCSPLSPIVIIMFRVLIFAIFTNQKHKKKIKYEVLVASCTAKSAGSRFFRNSNVTK